jgi:hypothetical protein
MHSCIVVTDNRSVGLQDAHSCTVVTDNRSVGLQDAQLHCCD